ncbi:MAG: homoserine O-acetyltransferase, partial [Bacteroidetes bacterium]
MKNLRINEPFVLESGEVLSHLEISYHTFGTLNANGDNVVWICHALTGNSNPMEWWPGVVGKGKAIDPEKDFIVCANSLGSCYGTTGPTSGNPETGQPFGESFPFITIRDMVQAQQLLQRKLGISKIHLGIGGSMGGQQLIEWAVMEPDLFENIALLASNSRHSAWGIAFNEAQRMAIKADLTAKAGKMEPGRKGLEAARAIAMLSYRTYDAYEGSQAESSEEIVDNFKASSYQRYQGEKFWKRFDVYSYLVLSKAMDSHNIGRGRDGVENALRKVKAKTLVISIRSDVLFPLAEQQKITKHIPDATLEIIDSPYGHDGFLIEAEAVSNSANSNRLYWIGGTHTLFLFFKDDDWRG